MRKTSPLKRTWRIWAYALGEKKGRSNAEADLIALLRTGIFISYLLTNIAIVAGVIRHWNDVPNQQEQIKLRQN